MRFDGSCCFLGILVCVQPIFGILAIALSIFNTADVLAGPVRQLYKVRLCMRQPAVLFSSIMDVQRLITMRLNLCHSTLDFEADESNALPNTTQPTVQATFVHFNPFVEGIQFIAELL